LGFLGSKFPNPPAIAITFAEIFVFLSVVSMNLSSSLDNPSAVSPKE
jgi:hypothetical protein